MHPLPRIVLLSTLLACEQGDESTPCGPVQRADYSDCMDLVALEPTCEADSCVPGGALARVFAAWRARAREVSGLGAAEFDARIHLRSVARETAGLFDDEVRLSIAYVYVNDWLRVSRVESIALSTLSDPATDAEIAAAVEQGLDRAAWRGIGRIDDPASERALQLAVDECACGVTLDWCQMYFDGEALRISGDKEVDAAANSCLHLSADPGVGALELCQAQGCVIL